MKSDYSDVIIGLEVHIQLTALKTKLFCSCSSDYRDKEPNTNVCPVCLGLPGALPVLNEKAFDFAIMLALALKCEISDKTLFFRKNYFYPDLPKNYQISQYDRAGGQPIGRNGVITIEIEDEQKDITIRRLHIEEDPGRLVHEGDITESKVTLIDYNRSGIALVEVVTEPVLHSPREARIFLQTLRNMVEHLGICDCKLSGSMRVDANISLKGFNRVEPVLQKKRIIIYGKMGKARTQFIKAEDLLKILVLILKKDPGFLLYDNPNCETCQRRKKE